MAIVSPLYLSFVQMEQSLLQCTMSQGVSMIAPLQNGATYIPKEEFIVILEETVLLIPHSAKSAMNFFIKSSQTDPCEVGDGHLLAMVI